MALESGTQLGVYRIVGPIGAGGMGEVYRATDTKLGRDVAIKTLPAALADDTDRLARFEREAKLLDVYAIELASGEASLVAEGGDGFPRPIPYALVPGDETLAIISAQNQTDADIATLSLAEGTFTGLLEGDGIQSEPSLSPNGAWIAYHDTASGAPGSFGEINIRPYPAVARTRIPVGPGLAPVFSRDGSELFFVAGEGIAGESIASVAVSYEPSLAIGPPRTIVSSSAYMWFSRGRPWDPDPSGERFIVIRDPATPNGGDGDEELSRIEVVVNWVEELSQRVPVP